MRGTSVITDKGLKIGRLQDMFFDEASGRISTLVVNPDIKGLMDDLPKDKSGNFLIPYNLVTHVSDRSVVDENQVLLLRSQG